MATPANQKSLKGNGTGTWDCAVTEHRQTEGYAPWINPTEIDCSSAVGLSDSRHGRSHAVMRPDPTTEQEIYDLIRDARGLVDG